MQGNKAARALVGIDMKLTLLLVLAPLLAARAAEPAPGEYVLDGGRGMLRLVKKDGVARFSIDVVGANAHTCQLDGTWRGTTGAVDDADSPCSISLEAQPDGVEVKAKDEEACRAWCGARAWFDGRYLLRAPECAPKKVTAAREAFKAHYKAKRFVEARAALSPVLERCPRVVDRFELMWLRNDLALTLHHLGDDAKCRELLEPLRELGETPDDEVGATEPSFADELKKLAKATRTNAQLCRAR